MMTTPVSRAPSDFLIQDGECSETIGEPRAGTIKPRGRRSHGSPNCRGALL